MTKEEEKYIVNPIRGVEIEWFIAVAKEATFLFLFYIKPTLLWQRPRKKTFGIKWAHSWEAWHRERLLSKQTKESDAT